MMTILIFPGLPDIAFNFLVGEDGNAYEGRGWDEMGGHTQGYDHNSIGENLILYDSHRKLRKIIMRYAFRKILASDVTS
jgi:hypothetical protein